MSTTKSHNYEDLSGTGMHFTLMPIVGIRNNDAGVVGAILLIDGKEQERFSLDENDLWIDSFGKTYTPQAFSAYLTQHVNEIRSKRKLAGTDV